MSHFSLRCTECGRELKETFCAFCEHCRDALLVTEYQEKGFRDDAGEGIWRFNWLRCTHRTLINQALWCTDQGVFRSASALITFI